MNYSKKSIAWLEWLRHCARVEDEIWTSDTPSGIAANTDIAYRARDIQPMHTYRQNPGGMAYEFHGCRYHGCPVCCKNLESVLIPNSGQTASELMAPTQHKERWLREQGMKVVVCWEHELDAVLK